MVKSALVKDDKRSRLKIDDKFYIHLFINESEKFADLILCIML